MKITKEIQQQIIKAALSKASKETLEIIINQYNEDSFNHKEALKQFNNKK